MTLPHYYELCEYWTAHPPLHELVAARWGYKKPQTTEEKWKSGAMNPAEALEWFRRTGGKIDGAPRG